MAQCKQTPQEFIKNTFTPHIAVLCTNLVEKSCQKNNLSFVELLQPFSKLNNDVHYKDPVNTTITVHDLKLTFLELNSNPPQSNSAKKILNSCVNESIEYRTQTIHTGDYKLDITLYTPWFQAWRNTFLRVQYPSDHEYTRHFLACLLVISTSDSNPVETINQLTQTLNQTQNISPGKLPKWFSSNVLKYYVVVHDNSDGNSNLTNGIYESIKIAFGNSNCFLLKINSRPPDCVNSEHLPDPWSQFIINEPNNSKTTPENSPNTNIKLLHEKSPEDSKIINYHPLSPDNDKLSINGIVVEQDKLTENNLIKTHGHHLSTDDIEQIKLLIYEFSQNCLLPYIEKQIQLLNDIISNKKGVSRSLFSATKRWFNPNKPGTSSIAINNLIYTPDSPELQIRHLGDLHFMFGNYNSAFQCYHLAKRDYNTDQAWLYYAGSLEMASLSAFMSNETNRKTCDYMEESITTYLNTCKLAQLATRATLLSTECLKSQGMYGEAAHQFIRMTSEESDLRSALFLEQAAYCFLHSKMVRKYAFHMVLAGHRFSKAAQRKHSLRSYKQAYQVYENSGWDLSEDHIHYTIGRQAHNLIYFEEAVDSFAKLLRGNSRQSAQQQGLFLKEYLTILGNKVKRDNNKEIPLLPLPELDQTLLKMLMGPTPPLTTPGKVAAVGINFHDEFNTKSENKWNKLEEILVNEAQGFMPVIFTPAITLYTLNNLNNKKNNPTAIVNEQIQVCIHLVNSLQITLFMRDIYLLWIFNDNKTKTVSNENTDIKNENFIKTHITKLAKIQAYSNENIILSLTPLAVGELNLIGICYVLSCSGEQNDNVFIKGKQLFNLSQNNQTNEKLLKQLLIKIIPSAPSLQVSFSEINLECLCDEIQKINIDFFNTGTVPLHKICMTTSDPSLLSSCQFDNKLNNKKKLANVITIPLKNDQLEPSELITFPIWIKAPNYQGQCIIDLLIYYECKNFQNLPKYRVIRHNWNLIVKESISLNLSTKSSYKSKHVEEIALALKVSNLNKLNSLLLTEIKLLNVGLLSEFWIITENFNKPDNLNLQSQDSAYLFLKAKRMSEKNMNYSNLILDCNKDNLNKAFITFAENIHENDDDINNELLNIDNNLNKTNQQDGLLILQWQALVNDSKNILTVNGQSHVLIKIERNDERGDQLKLRDNLIYYDGINIFDESSTNNKTSNNNVDNSNHTKLTYNLLHPSIVQHNFNKNKLCVINVTLLVHSIVTDTLYVIINTLGDYNDSNQSTNLFYPHASNSFSWLGHGRVIRNLKPLSTEEIPLAVVVPRSGTFNLGTRLQVLCNTVKEIEGAILQTGQLQSSLIVVNS